MIEFKSPNKPRIAVLLDNQVEITFTTTKSVIKAFETLKDKELSITVKEFKPKRSLSQNAYLWAMLNDIAIKMERSKEDIYKDYIKDYGVFEIIPIKNEAVSTFSSMWSKNGIGWFTEDLGESKLNGYTKLLVYFGSSSYTTTQMKRLIDAVVTDCHELGISTMTLSEIMLLKNDND